MTAGEMLDAIGRLTVDHVVTIHRDEVGRYIVTATRPSATPSHSSDARVSAALSRLADRVAPGAR